MKVSARPQAFKQSRFNRQSVGIADATGLVIDFGDATLGYGTYLQVFTLSGITPQPTGGSTNKAWYNTAAQGISATNPPEADAFVFGVGVVSVNFPLYVYPGYRIVYIVSGAGVVNGTAYHARVTGWIMSEGLGA